MKQILAAILLMSTSAFAFNQQIHVYKNNSKSDNEILFIYPEQGKGYTAEGIYQRGNKTKHWQAKCALMDSNTLSCHYIHKSGNSGTGELILKENQDKTVTANVKGIEGYEKNPNYFPIIPKS